MKIQFQGSSVPNASSNSRELPLQSTENPQWGMMLTRIKEFLNLNQLINQRQKVAVPVAI